MKLYSTFEISELIEKRISGEITETEKITLETWVSSSSKNRAIYEKLTTPDFIRSYDLSKDEPQAALAYTNFITKAKVLKRRKSLVRRLSIAAAVICPFIIGSYLILTTIQNKLPVSENRIATANIPIIYAEKSQAVLRLSDGREVSLDAKNKFIDVKKDSIVINKESCIAANNTTETIPQLNVLQTQKGGTVYQMTLNDGTKVYLNSDSEIKFPTSFDAKNRKVFIKGEVFFEVTKNRERKFTIETEMGSVEVLGTTFNVRCYPEEKTTVTTLVEGSVCMSDSNRTITLTPNEQCCINERGMSIQQVDCEEYISWTIGKLMFRDKSLEYIMANLSHIYNIEVEYGSEDLKNILFNGSFDRNEELNSIIQMLEISGGIAFKIDGSKLIIKNE